jgi:hypothetical protein
MNIKTRRDVLLKRLAHQDEIDPLTEAVNRVADQVDTRLEPRISFSEAEPRGIHAPSSPNRLACTTEI